MYRQTTIPLWERNHSVEKLNKAEKENNRSYLLGYRMLKEVQDPNITTYLNFSDKMFPEGNVCEFDFEELSEPLCLTCDFNRGVMGWLLGQKQKIDDEWRYIILHDMEGINVTTRQHAKTVGEWILDNGYGFVELYGDGTANQGGKKGYGRHGTNDWKDVTDVFDELGLLYKKKFPRSNPNRNERIRIVRNMIYTTSEGEVLRRLLIHKRCDKVIDDYLYSVRDGEELKKKRQGDRGHKSDAGDYWIIKGQKEISRVTYIK